MNEKYINNIGDSVVRIRPVCEYGFYEFCDCDGHTCWPTRLVCKLMESGLFDVDEELHCFLPYSDSESIVLDFAYENRIELVRGF